MAIEVTPKTKAHMDALVSYMLPGQSYKASDLEGVTDVKSSRLRSILNQMVEMQLLIAEGDRKLRTYRRVLIAEARK